MSLTQHRLDPFRILSADERRTQQEGLLRQMMARDGEVWVSGRRLAQREVFLEEIRKPIHWVGPKPSQQELVDHLSGRRPSQDPRILWLATATRGQLGEQAGIDPELDRFDRRNWAGADLGLTYMALEDHYHTLLFEQLLRCCGIEPKLDVPRPYAFWRWLMNYLPDSVRFAPVLVGETCGATLMIVLAETVAVFREPELEARLRWITEEIVTDELGHVAYSRARVRPAHMRIARRLVHPAARALVQSIPEAASLAGGRDRLVDRMVRGPLLTEAALSWLGPDARD
jgi:hypothetical protein